MADTPGRALDQRRAELAAGLDGVRTRIAAACAAAGRPTGDLTLIAITKTYPARDVVLLADLGVGDVGENRDQEAAPKAAAVSAAGRRPRWHFVGRLQRNKCRSVAGYADVVQSVDSVRLATALAEAAHRRERSIDVLVQVSIDGAAGRGGAYPDRSDPDRALSAVTAAVAELEPLRLRGLMAVAPPDWPPDEAFARLAEVYERIRADHPTATILSAGMSDDLEAAVAYGATHVRVGSALLGKRPPLG